MRITREDLAHWKDRVCMWYTNHIRYLENNGKEDAALDDEDVEALHQILKAFNELQQPTKIERQKRKAANDDRTDTTADRTDTDFNDECSWGMRSGKTT